MLAEVDALQGRALLQPLAQASLCRLYTRLMLLHPCNTAMTCTLADCHSHFMWDASV